MICVPFLKPKSARRPRRINAKSWCLLALILMGCVSCSFACQSPTDPPTVKPPDISADYVIGIDDILEVSDVTHDDISQTVPVLSDGKIQIKGIDDGIKAAGLTVAQLRARITEGLDRLYNNLQISVTVRESHSRNVTVIGTKISGQFPLRPGMRISTLLALGGGLASKTKLSTGTLLRTGKGTHLSLAKIVGENPDPAADLPLQANDIVVVETLDEATPPTYSVLGAVAKPGSFYLPQDNTPITIARAIADAGGPEPDRAALKKVTVQRNGEKIVLDLYPLLTQGKADAQEGKFQLQNNDVILVPELQQQYAVLGQATRPGTFTLPEGKTIHVADAISEAGGPTQLSEQKKVTLFRVVNGKQTVIPIDLLKLLTKGDPNHQNVEIQDKDLLYIPTKGQKTSLTDALSPLYILGVLGLRAF